MSGFVKRNKSVNPAGGINPAVQPNVGQYGWTTFDAANVNQLIDYVKAAREAAESARNDAEYVKLQLVNIDNTVLYFERLYNEIKPIAANIEAIYLEITRIRDRMDIQIADVERMHTAILEMFAEIQNILNEMRSLRDETKVYKDSAKQSEVASVEAMEKSLEIYEELKKGQVYRGTWNPNTAKYPDHGNTNSVWDVVLNTGQTEVDYDGKKWFFGDRLIYVKDTNRYEQLEAGTNVKSVNGKTGSVVLDAADVKAVPISGGTMTGQLNMNAPIQVNKGQAIRAIDDASVNTRMVPSNGYGYFQAGHTTDEASQKMLLTGMSGRGLTEFQIRMVSGAQPQVRLGSSNYNIYHVGNKPTASDVGAVARSGDTMTGPLTVPATQGIRTNTQSDGSYTAMSSESGYSLLWRRNQSNTVGDEFIGIRNSALLFRQDKGLGDKSVKDHKVYHEGFKPTAADIGAMGSAGGTITGDLILNERLTVQKDVNISLNSGVRKLIKSFGAIDNNKGALVMFCPVASSTGQAAQGFNGRITLHRGAADQYNLISWIELTARVAYTELAAHIHDQYSNRSAADTMKLVQTKYNNADWVALYIPSTASRIVAIEGEVTGSDPVFIKNADGYSMVDFITTTDIVRSTRQARALDVTDTSSTGGYKFNTKVAIGGQNDTWLRLNPNNHFSSGIYSSTGTIRHDGGTIQIKNWSTGTARPVQLSVPTSEQYAVSNPGVAALGVKAPASNNATRLINYYDADGVIKSSIVARDDDTGSISVLTHGAKDATKRVTISDGNVFAYGAQNASDNALVQRKFVNDTFVRKAGDSMTGKLSATEVEATLSHRNGYMNIKAYNSGYVTEGSFIRGYYREHDLNKPGVGWSGLKFDKFTPASGDTPSKSENFEMMLGTNLVYHQGRKPTPSEIGAMLGESTHVNTSVDLDTYTKNGTYNLYGPSSVTFTNAPAGFQYGTLLVIGRGAVTNSFVTQTLTNKNNNMQWTRSRTDGSFGWTGWSAIYSEANPPKLESIDAVLRTGDTMSGHLYMDNDADIYLRGKDNNPIIWFVDKDTNKSKVAVYHDRTGDSAAINHYDSATNTYAGFRMKHGNKAPTYSPGTGGTFHLYHEGFKPSAGDVGAPVLNSSTKAIELQSNTSSVKGGAIRTEADGAQQVSWMTDKPLSESYKAIGVHSQRGPVYNDGQIREIYHTGRKPTAADISGVLTQGQWGIGDYPGFADAADAKDYTEDKSLDFNKLITTGTYSVSGNWVNSVNNLGTAQGMTATIQVIARKWGAGPTVYQKLIMGISTDGSRYAERTGSGTYPNITWSRWRESGTYQVNAEYRMTIERPGEVNYPYLTLSKKEPRKDMTSGYYAVGAVQFKHNVGSDPHNPDGGSLVGLVRSDVSFDQSDYRTILSVRDAATNAIGTELILDKDQAWITKNLRTTGEIRSVGSNSYRMGGGSIGTFWRKDSDNLYLLRTEDGQAESGSFSTHRPFSMKLSDASITVGTMLTAKGGLTVEAGQLTLGTNAIKGYNGNVVLRDHGNGNVTLSASQNSSGVAGDLYLGYNGTGFSTRNVRMDSQLINRQGEILINSGGYINGDFIRDGAVQTLVDDSNVRHTIIGGNDTVNRGRTIVAAGESGKQVADNTSTGAEDLYLSADGSVFIETAVQSGWGTRKTIKATSGELYAVDGTKRVYHQGYKPTAADVNAAPDGFGLGGNGVRCPNEDCNQAVANGFYAIYAGTTNTPEGTGPSGCKMLVVSWSTQHVSQTFYRVSDNRTWTRSSKLISGAVEWSDWAELYTTARKPSAADVGALSVTGGNLAGGLNIVSDAGLIVRKTNGTHGFRTVESGGFIYLQGGNTDSAQVDDQKLIFSGYQGRGLTALNFLMKDTNTHPAVRVGSTNYPIYHTGNKPGAGDVGALSLTGGTLTGDLKISGSKKLIFPTDTYAAGSQIYAQDADQYGANLIITSGGATVLGSGEAGQAAANALADKTLVSGENMYLASDANISFFTGANAFADRKTATLSSTGQLDLEGNLVVNGNSKKITVGTGPSDVWLQNSKSGKYLQMKDDASLQYDSKHIYYKGNPNTLGGMIGESKAIGAVEDLDNYKTPGVYHQSANTGATNGANYPEKLAGSLVVYQAAGIVQEYRIYNTSRMWRRAQYSSGAWSAWTSDYNSGNKPSAADVGALSLTDGGSVYGITSYTNHVNMIGNRLKFYNGSSTHHNIESVGNSLHFTTGANGENFRMGLDANGQLQLTNNLVVDDGRILNQRTANPMIELHCPGKNAAIMYLDSSGILRFSSSNGGGADVGNFARMHGGGVDTPFRFVTAKNTTRSWTDVGNVGFYNDSGAVMADGTYHGLTSLHSIYSGAYAQEMSLGYFSANRNWEDGKMILQSYNSSTGGASRWMFGTNGNLEPTAGGWRLTSGGQLTGSAYGGSTIAEWCQRSFAPASDGALKTILGESKSSALEQVGKMKFHEYVWNDDQFAKKSVKVNKIGVIAQEMEEIDANYTRDVETFNEKGEVETSVKTLDTANLLAVALKAIQELNAEVAELKRQLGTK